MAQTTLWYVNDIKFDELSKRLENNRFFENSDYYPGFEIEKILNSQNSLESVGINSDIKFNVYEYSYSFSGQHSSSSRLTGTLILFEFNNKLGFIVDKAGYNNALSFLRELYKSNKKKTIVPAKYDDSIMNGSLFLWMISKIYNNDSTINYDIGEEKKTITLNSLDGVKGKSRTGLNNVSTQGSDVINMLTTLAFLLESERLTEVGLNISFDTHDSLQLEIKTHNRIISLDVKPEEYMGPLTNNELCQTNGKVNLVILRSIILLTVHLSLIPMLYSLYKADIAGTNVKDDLVSEISADMANRLQRLKKETADLEEKITSENELQK
ncbi:hypothetical protein [Limosilactobacillus reuteri]|uniref:Uncharacterized protein n=1 Tax=Limosilactobacillus reuteri TaxID=1598 RepID=A0AB36AB49_LIMRT|nr:hypothetical protein [Limosilactobacillus reuteri]MCH5358522.1 hypothetical protein [Limosilactobacillus reuteri]MRG83188.1 hypothetical protein [Limosilactobacillus reuteri]